MRAKRLSGWIALALALPGLVALLPIPPQMLTNQLDTSFGATLHFGAAHGYTVGSDLISTFGPLGFVFYGIYYPATFAWLMGLRVLLAAATAWTLAWIGHAARGSTWGSAVALLACVPFFAPPDVWFLTLPLLAVFIELTEGRSPPAGLRIALGAAIGLVSLIKFTFLLSALAVLGPLSVAALLARRVPLPAIAALVAAAVAWFSTGHTTADVFRYVDWSWREISTGYASAMQLPADPALLVWAAAASVAVLVTGVMLVRRRLRKGRWAAATGMAAVLFLLFKAGFVRADVHVFIAASGLVVVAVLLVLLWARRPAELAAGILLVAAPAWLWSRAVAVYGRPELHFAPVFLPRALGRLALLPRMFAEGALASEHARCKASVSELNPLPPLEGAVDVYPYDQALVLANDLDFRPRPVFQSYMAYSVRLARANADHLTGDDPPAWLLFRVAPIDQHLAALEDASSWPLFLSHYRLGGQAGEFVLLQRRERPLRSRFESLGRFETTTDRLVKVPPADAGPIWVHVDLQETRRDALMGVLLAGPASYVGIERRDGVARGFRLLPGLARDGFLLSPVVESTDEFAQLMTSVAVRERACEAVSFMVRVADAPGIDPAPRAVTGEFFRLRIDE